MKKISFCLIISFAVLAAACGPRDNHSRLTRLESQREALTRQIEQLRAEIARESGQAPPVESAVPVTISRIEPGLFQHFIRVQGTIESDNNILVSPQSPGVVEKIHVKTGDRVSPGELLAELDAAVLKSSIAEVENGLGLARTIYERQARLWKKNIGSEIEYLQAQNNVEGLERKLETLREQVRKTRITAPIGGTVDEILIKEGEMAAAGRGALRIVQLSRLKLTASLSENYISRIKLRDRVTVEIPVLGRRFEHTIDAVSQVIDPQNRTFQIEVRIPQSEKGLKPNLLAVVTVNDYSNPEALTIPVRVLQETGSDPFLFLAEEENGEWVARRRPIRIGENYAGRVEVIEGIRSGDFVVTFGFNNLADGQPLSVQRED